MTTPASTAEQMARKCAGELVAKWTIGRAATFCDDPPEFDTASEEEIARKIIVSIPIVELVEARDGFSALHEQYAVLVKQNAALMEVAKVANWYQSDVDSRRLDHALAKLSTLGISLT